MSMNILRATKLKYGAIHSAEPKQMCSYVLIVLINILSERKVISDYCFSDRKQDIARV